MTISEQQRDAFKEFEKATWNKQAENYDVFAGQMTRRAVDGLLDAVGVNPGTRLLDVATGPGYVAAEATRRGAEAIAVRSCKSPHGSSSRSPTDLALDALYLIRPCTAELRTDGAVVILGRGRCRCSEGTMRRLGDG